MDSGGSDRYKIDDTPLLARLETAGKGRGRCFRFPSSGSYSVLDGFRGSGQFLAKLYGLPTPTWPSKEEYFLPEPDYSNCAISFGDGDHVLLLPENEDEDFRLRARTSKEMLRRNVIFAARNLTTL